jgi:hypothetical protein
MATQNTQQRTFDVNYCNDFVQRQIAGAKGTKGNGRPFIFDVRNFKLDTRSDGTIIQTYLLFGGVPPKALHEKLEAAGFKVRRRPASWTGKDDKVHPVDGSKYELYAVYYNTEPAPTQEQAKLIASLMYKTLNAVKDKGVSFLLPSWDAVDNNWGDRKDWLNICTVEPEEEQPAAATSTIDMNDVDLDDMF